MRLDSSRWQQIASLYESALELDPTLRGAFLAEACAGDDALRSEVESLLREDAPATLLDRPIWATAAALLESPALETGMTLGPYRIVRRLGAGGMGEVLHAIDTRLNRPVAIKVLRTAVAMDAERRARFAVEARAVAALTHPHICTLYDVGRQDDIDFLVMEYLDGDTLAARLGSGRMPVDEALTRAIDIAGALAHAHRQQIVHRDLKPANIMLTPAGAKLLDFGLAKILAATAGDAPDGDTGDSTASPEPDPQPESDSADREEMTRGGAIIGTIRYMAPERLSGHKADVRSDLFSFGVVLYQMLTGTRPFDGDTVADVRASLLHHEPPPPSSTDRLVPGTVDAIVQRCLQKNPGDRWQTADDVLLALREAAAPPAERRRDRSRRWRGWSAAAAVLVAMAAFAWTMAGGRGQQPTSNEIQSLAVLPLESLSGRPQDEYLADGLTERVTADLATIDGLRVISRTSALHFKDARKPATVIARELRVDAIIEGALAEADGGLRITARLISGANGQVVWAQKFEGNRQDVTALQNEVVHGITTKVGGTMSGGQPPQAAKTQPADPAVYRSLLLAGHHAGKGTREGLQRAVEFFNQAIAREPAYAPAYAGLAEAWTELSGFYVDPRQAMPEAKRAAAEAIRLDDTLAEAHAALGYASLVYDWDGPAAARSLRRALDLNPTLATARLNYAAYLSTQGRHEEAVREIERAVERDPLSVRTHVLGAMLLMFTRRADLTLALTRRGLELEPDSGFMLAVQGVAYADQRRYAEAVDSLRRAVRLDDSLTIRALQAHVLAVAGLRKEAAEVLGAIEAAAKHQYFCPYEIGTVYVSLGDHDTAAALFRKGTDEHADCMAWLGVEPWLDAFRSDSRYPALLRRIGLAPGAR